MDSSNSNNYNDSYQCGCYCENRSDNEAYDFHLKTGRPVLNSYKLKWTVDDFSILPIGKIKSPDFYPMPDISCFIEILISADDLSVLLCFHRNDLYVDCDFSISDINGLVLYRNFSTMNADNRFDLTNNNIRICFPKFKAAAQNKLILNFCMKIRGAATTDICELGSVSTSCQISNLKKLSNDFLSTFKNSVNTDVKLNTRDNQTIAAHRAVLSARSSVFAKMFEYEMKERAQQEVYVSDVAFDTLKKLVEFLYSAELCDLDDLNSAYDLYYAADKYNVLDLRKMCGDVLLTKLTVDNACLALATVDQHDDKFIRSKIIQFICLHLKEIVNSEAWNTYMDNGLSAEVITMSLTS